MIILALLLVLFGKVGVFMLVNVFHVINYVVVLYMNSVLSVEIVHYQPVL